MDKDKSALRIQESAKSRPSNFPIQIEESQFRKIAKKIDDLLQSPVYEILMTVVTFLVLYADDVRMLALKKQSDDGYYYFMLTCFFIFLTEILVLSVVRQGYLFSFFFFMDLLSTFSTVMEIPLVMSDLLNIDVFSSQKSTKLAKAGRASRVSSRATKVIRVVRLIRLYAYKSIESKLQNNFKFQLEMQKTKQEQVVNRKQLEEDLNEEELENQDVLRYNSKMIPKPKIQPAINNDQGTTNRNILETQRQNDQKKAVIPVNHSTIRVDITAGQGYQDPRKTQNSQIIEFGEKPIQYEEQNSQQSEDENDFSEINEEEKHEEELVKEGVAVKQDSETKVGKILSDLTTRRAIMVMFSIMISIPLLDYGTYFQDMSAYDTGLMLMENIYNSPPGRIRNFLNQTQNVFIETLDSSDYKMFFFAIDNITFLNNLDYLEYRDDELKQYFTDSGIAKLLVNNKDESNLNAILGIIRTSFVIFVLVVGAIFFSKDANDLVVTPIENMLAKVQRIADNPLEAARIEEELALAEDQLKKDKLDESLRKNKLQQQGFETVILERLIVKTGALLAIGFGEAGAEIIGANMKQDGAVNPMIPGKKIFAMFGFCDIRGFSDITEALEEKVFMFVNEVAEIVHSTINSFEGATNKNIGEAFLLVWKFPSDVIKMNKEYPEILNLRLVNNYADLALLSLIKIFISVRKSENIHNYTRMQQIQDRLPNYTISMGFGLHVGWAIEGAIGSYFKIDASYLSPNVNMASRLEAATRQYGVYHLISGPIYRLLSNVAQSRMRHVDRVTVKGSIQPVDMFTFDFDISQLEDKREPKPIYKRNQKKIMRYQERLNREKRLDQIRREKLHINYMFEKDQDIVLVQNNREKYTEQFYSTFHDGVNSYLQGRWTYAKSCFEKTKMLLPQDGPSITLLNYMSQFNYDAPEDWKGYRELTEK